MLEFDYYVYIVQCSDGSYYTGITNSVKRRVIQHNKGMNPFSYTFTRRPVKLVYSAHFNDVWDAISWEKQVKRWSRKKKEALIRRDFDEICRLAKKDFSKKPKPTCHPE